MSSDEWEEVGSHTAGGGEEEGNREEEVGSLSSGGWEEASEGAGDWNEGDNELEQHEEIEMVQGDYEGEGGESEEDIWEANRGEERTQKSREGARRRSTTGYKRNYFWCPVVDCTSGPVQKIGQHLAKVHKMDKAKAAAFAKKKMRAPSEAVKLRIPNPAKRSSGIRTIPAQPSTSTASRPSTSKTPPRHKVLPSIPEAPFSSRSKATSRPMQEGTGTPPRLCKWHAM